METLHPLLDIRDLEITFQKGKQSIHAVAGVNVQLQKGTTLGIVGESGSGKSTLARAVVQLVPVTSGSIVFDPIDVSVSWKHSVQNHV